MTPPSLISLWRETKALSILAFPIILSQLAQMGMNFTDTVMAGRHSETSLAGVAVGSSVWVPCFLLTVGMLMAVTPMVAHALGAKQMDDIRHTLQQAIWLALACGVTMLIVLQGFTFGFEWVAMDAEVRAQAIGYAKAVSFGLPALALFQALRGFSDGLHLTRPFLYVSMMAVLLNIPLNYIFIYGLFGLPEMGGIGCGWATAMILWLEAGIMLWISLKHPKLAVFSWVSGWRRPQRRRILELLKLGAPIGVALLIEASMFSLIALFLAQLGSVAVAGHQVAMSFISLLFMVPLGFALALTIRCGYLLGQGNIQQARYVGYLGIGLTLVAATVYCLLILVAANAIAGIYTHNEEVRNLAVQLLFLAAIFQFSDAIQVAATGALRGYKDTEFAFYVVVLSYWGVGLPLGYSLGLTRFWGEAFGAKGFWMGLIAGLGLASLLLCARFVFISGHRAKLPA